MDATSDVAMSDLDDLASLSDAELADYLARWAESARLHRAAVADVPPGDPRRFRQAWSGWWSSIRVSRALAETRRRRRR